MLRTSWSGVERTSESAPELNPSDWDGSGWTLFPDWNGFGCTFVADPVEANHHQRQDEDGCESECGLLHRRAPFGLR